MDAGFTTLSLKAGAFDFMMAYFPRLELQNLFQLELINRGVFASKSGEFVISTVSTRWQLADRR